jgi:hypothetical protein
MGVRVTGFDELLADLESLPARAAPAFRRVVAKGAVNIKMSWRRRWSPIARAPHNAPHLARGVGYDTSERGGVHFEAEIGVHPANPQAPLAHFPEFGSVRNAPTPGGAPALDEEEPRFVRAVAEVAEELLDGGGR